LIPSLVGFSTNKRCRLLAHFTARSTATLKNNGFFELARPLH